MSRKPSTHLTLPAELRPHSLIIEANAGGGFTASAPAQDYGRTSGVRVAFTTIEEMLEWLRVNMARPAQEPTPEVGR